MPGGAAVILAAVACTASPAPSTGSPSTSAASPGGAARTAAGLVAAPGLAGDCTGAPLKSQLAAAVGDGASVIVADGVLTGRSQTGNPAFYAMTLASVRTLRGPAVAPGSTAWIPGPAPGTTANPENSALLAPGGRVFAVAWPKAATRDPVGPVLQLAPVVGAVVVFTPYSCWNLDGLQPDQYQSGTPLRPVPGGANFGGTHQAAENGLYTLPLATVEQVAASA